MERPFVAHVLDAHGDVYDSCWTWEAAQNYALSEGLRVVALCDDGHMSKADIQALCDAERERFLDCFTS